MKYNYVKSVKNDAEYGRILYVNFSPFKVCNYNCQYCNSGPTTDKINERQLFYPPENIFMEIKDFMEKNPPVDYFWLSGVGDATLYSGFFELSSMLKTNYPEVKIGLNTNGALFEHGKVRKDFLISDLIVIDLNTTSADEFHEICRPHEKVNYPNVLQGIREFRNNFTGEFIILTIFIKGINDKLDSLHALKDLFIDLHPTKIVIKEFTCNGYGMVSQQFKNDVKNQLEDLSSEVLLKFCS